MKRLAAIVLIGAALFAQTGCDELDYAYSFYGEPGYYTDDVYYEDVYYEDTYDEYWYDDSYSVDVWYDDWFGWPW